MRVQVVVGPPLIELGLEPMLANSSSTLHLWATAWDGAPYPFTTQAATATLPGQVEDIEIPLAHTGSAGAGLWEEMWGITAQVPHGPNEVIYRGLDSSGYEGDGSPQGLYVDRYAPAAPVIHSPPGHTYTRQDVVAVQGAAGAYDTVILTVGGSPVTTTQANATGWWRAEVDLIEGENEIVARAHDLAGNESSDSAPTLVSRDTTPPQVGGGMVPSMAPAGWPITASAIVTDAGEVRRVVVELEDVGDYSLGRGTGSHARVVTLPGYLEDGWRSAVFDARDVAGNVGVFTTTFLVDSTPPTITLTLSERSDYAHVDGAALFYGLGSGAFTVTAALEDTLAGLAQVAFPEATCPGASYSLGGALSVAQGHVYVFTEGANEQGVYQVTASDCAANENSAVFTLTRDVEPPEVWLDVPHRIYSGTTSIPVTWGATDPSTGSGQAGSGVARYDVQVRVEDGDWTDWLTGTLDTEATYALGEGGWFTFRVIATDNVSNAGSAEAASSFARVTKYYYHGGQRVAMRAGDVVYYLHGDHLGSTSLTTDGSGVVVGRQLYHPYGTVRAHQGTLPTDFGFTGQRHDSTELIFMHARYYHPALGRFASADVVVPVPGNPQDWNRYTYVANNPTRSIDPTGHFIFNRPSWMYLVPGLNVYAYAKDCATSVSQAAEAYNAGERRVGALAMHATGATDYLVRQTEPLHQLNEDVSVVFSHAPIEERLPHAVHLGWWGTEKAASIVSMVQLASVGIRATQASQLADDAVGQLTDDVAGGVRKVGGRNPINYRYAGETHPSGVRFTNEGFPDFSPYATEGIEIKGLTGVYAADAAMANEAVSLSTTPQNMVWHHVEDARTMLLIPRNIHQAARHTGGAAVIRHMIQSAQ